MDHCDEEGSRMDAISFRTIADTKCGPCPEDLSDLFFTVTDQTLKRQTLKRNVKKRALIEVRYFIASLH